MKEPTILGFRRRSTIDSYGRRITLFVSPLEPPTGAAIAVYVQGSGCHSLFRRGEHGEFRGGYHVVLEQVMAGRGQVVAVEKPGVPFLNDPGPRGTAEGCPPSFLREHTLPRWVAALRAAIDHVTGGPSPGKPVLVLGHSEGAIVAATLAAEDPRISHLALLSGSGPTQLFDLLAAARREAATDADAAHRTHDVLADYGRIRRNPEALTLTWGHPNRRWTSFLSTSTIEQLRRTTANLYLVHGTADEVVPVQSFDMMIAELIRDGRPLRVERIDGATHSLSRADESSDHSAAAIFARIVDWFLEAGA
jgi:pimeloyl-ACP methyl ester carboxylesterase